MKYQKIKLLLTIQIFGILSCGTIKPIDTENNKNLIQKIQVSENIPKDFKIDNGKQHEITIQKINLLSEQTSDYDILVEAEILLKNKHTREKKIVKPLVYLQDSLIYSIPDFTVDSTIQISIKGDFLSITLEKFTPREFKKFVVRLNERFQFEKYNIILEGINRNPQHYNLNPKTDIAAGAKLKIEKNQKRKTVEIFAEPIFFIRNNQVFTINDIVEEENLVLIFSKIDPQKEKFTIEVGKFNNPEFYPIEIELKK